MNKWLFWLFTLGIFCLPVDKLLDENWGCDVYPQDGAQLVDDDGLFKATLPAWGGFDLWTRTAISGSTNPNKFHVVVKAAANASPLKLSFSTQENANDYILKEFDNDFKLFSFDINVSEFPQRVSFAKNEQGNEDATEYFFKSFYFSYADGTILNILGSNNPVSDDSSKEAESGVSSNSSDSSDSSDSRSSGKESSEITDSGSTDIPTDGIFCGQELVTLFPIQSFTAFFNGTEKTMKENQVVSASSILSAQLWCSGNGQYSTSVNQNTSDVSSAIYSTIDKESCVIRAAHIIERTCEKHAGNLEMFGLGLAAPKKPQYIETTDGYSIYSLTTGKLTQTWYVSDNTVQKYTEKEFNSDDTITERTITFLSITKTSIEDKYFTNKYCDEYENSTKPDESSSEISSHTEDSKSEESKSEESKSEESKSEESKSEESKSEESKSEESKSEESKSEESKSEESKSEESKSEESKSEESKSEESKSEESKSEESKSEESKSEESSQKELPFPPIGPIDCNDVDSSALSASLSFVSAVLLIGTMIMVV